jgi:Heterokaryon incompatibility protein (HET)
MSRSNNRVRTFEAIQSCLTRSSSKEFELAMQPKSTECGSRMSLQIPELEGQQVPLPTRVLDVGKFAKRGFLRRPSSRGTSIRLVTPKIGATGQYLTLSHRWGSSQHFTLTSASSNSFHESIPFESLPKTFQDAVSVTRELGYQYLWIDALCIVQDDLQEWFQEAPKMASVYHNSTCTIAAHSAKNDNEGFLAAAFEPTPLLHFARRTRTDGARSSGWWSLAPGSIFLGSSFNDEVNESFLSRRGWVFQERILSRRILHFTRHHVFFEDGSRVQTLDMSTSHSPWTHSQWMNEKIMVQDIVATTSYWYKLIETYSTCALTFDTDRLAAIAGIAQFVNSYQFAGAYLFGLWSKSLHQGLLWVAADDSPEEVCYVSELAPPSWSWARWKGSIRFPLQIAGCKPLFKLTDEPIFPENTPLEKVPTYQLCHLSIQAEVLDLRDVEAIVTNRPIAQSSFDPPIHGLYTLSSETSGRPFKLLDWVLFDGTTQNELHFPSLSCALISSYENVDWQYDTDLERTVSSRWRIWFFLILVETASMSNCYRRVGMGAKFGNYPQSKYLVTRTLQIE